METEILFLFVSIESFHIFHRLFAFSDTRSHFERLLIVCICSLSSNQTEKHKGAKRNPQRWLEFKERELILCNENIWKGIRSFFPLISLVFYFFRQILLTSMKFVIKCFYYISGSSLNNLLICVLTCNDVIHFTIYIYIFPNFKLLHQNKLIFLHGRWKLYISVIGSMDVWMSFSECEII